MVALRAANYLEQVRSQYEIRTQLLLEYQPEEVHDAQQGLG